MAEKDHKKSRKKAGQKNQDGSQYKIPSEGVVDDRDTSDGQLISS